jgi:hypothetical protein
LVGVILEGKAVLLRVNESDWRLKKEDEIDLEMGNCSNVAFNGDGKLAVVVGRFSQIVVLEVGRFETNSEKLIFKRKRNFDYGGSE